MYVPDAFQATDIASMHHLMRTHPLGTLVTATTGGIEANHIPFLLDAGAGDFGTLHAHVARANTMWQSAAGAEALVIFHGPEAFISPSWYATKAETGKVVPTWNYVVVHARGVVRVIEDTEGLRAHVTALTAEHESGRERPWAVADAPAAFIDRLLGAIVGIEIPIARLEGKWKVSQNRSQADRLGVIEALEREDTDRSRSMADAVRRAMPDS